ncbi:MAG: DUF4301 family protein [Dysgonamonadaceae bacterium]|nr:DUF4301 family protein [Dysgonamonadaceae bacterium]
MLSPTDLKQLQEKNITSEQIEEQLHYFRQGFPFVRLAGNASIEKGIEFVPEEEQKRTLNAWSDYLEQDREIVKFVPASGAASRMFKNLFAFLDADYSTPQTSFETTFFDKIHCFAFYQALNQYCIFNEGKTIDELIEEKNYQSIVENLLFEKGLNYGKLPKGLILFHSYKGNARTAMEEHWVEGALYACNKLRKVHVHFTVSPEHLPLFESLTNKKLAEYENELNVGFSVDFSIQKTATDTISVDTNNVPIREDGQLVFRPGGHGALIENLNDLSADVVFIKNIDNVVPDSFKSITVQYKELLAGVLVEYQSKIFDYLHLIDSGKYSHEQLLEMLSFLRKKLNVKNPETKMLEDVELVLHIKSKLNRPLRVCGMVKNTGEPGGGPFFVHNSDGTISLQILESSQINKNDAEMKSLFENGTHFNPVDLVCGLKNYKGEKFNLRKHVDKNTGFISSKSKNGKELRALELPGLWNGAMADWNTVFVEVPLETFNPVKTVNDLLRKEHQTEP